MKNLDNYILEKLVIGNNLYNSTNVDIDNTLKIIIKYHKNHKFVNSITHIEKVCQFFNDTTSNSKRYYENIKAISASDYFGEHDNFLNLSNFNYNKLSDFILKYGNMFIYDNTTLKPLIFIFITPGNLNYVKKNIDKFIDTGYIIHFPSPTEYIIYTKKDIENNIDIAPKKI